MIYIIDTDSLIALRRVYSPLYFVSLWEQLNALIDSGVLISTRINYDELKILEDDPIFLEWKQEKHDMFLEITEDVQSITAEVLYEFPDLIDPNLDQEQADPYLIALALHKNGTVITEEKLLAKQAVSDPNRKAKMRIPNVCLHYKLPVMNIVEFINCVDWR